MFLISLGLENSSTSLTYSSWNPWQPDSDHHWRFILPQSFYHWKSCLYILEGEPSYQVICDWLVNCSYIYKIPFTRAAAHEIKSKKQFYNQYVDLTLQIHPLPRILYPHDIDIHAHAYIPITNRRITLQLYYLESTRFAYPQLSTSPVNYHRSQSHMYTEHQECLLRNIIKWDLH